MVTTIVILKSLGLIVLFLGLFLVVGQLITTRRLRFSGFDTIGTFEAVFNGLLMVVSLFAIIQTKGKSVLLPVPFLLLIFNWNHTKHDGKTLSREKSKKVFLFIL